MSHTGLYNLRISVKHVNLKDRMLAMRKVIRVAEFIFIFSICYQNCIAQASIDTTKENVDSKVLEERIARNDEVTQTKLTALEKELGLRSESLEKRMATYVWGIGIIFAVLGFLGYKTIASWIKQIIEAKTGEALETVWKSRFDQFAEKRSVELDDIWKGRVNQFYKNREELERMRADLSDLKDSLVRKEEISDKSKGDLAKYEEKLEQTKEEKDYTFDDWYYKGLGEYNDREFEKAKSSWLRALEMDPSSFDIHFHLGYLFYDLGKFVDSIFYYSKALELNFEHVYALNNRGNSYNEIEEYEKAIEDLDKAISLDPNNAHAYNNRGNSYLGLQQFDKAIENYDKAVELDPNYDMAYQNRGNTYNAQKEYRNGIEDTTKAIMLNPSNKLAYNTRGNSYYGLKKYEKAIENYDKAVEINPNFSNAYNNRGNSYQHLGEYKRAIEDYDKAIEIDPNLALPYIGRGNSYNRLREYGNAILDYTKSIELDPKDAGGYLAISELNIIIGEYDKALEYLNKSFVLKQTTEYEIIGIYLMCIAEKLMNRDASESETELAKILEKDFEITWSFFEIDRWLGEADLPEDAKTFIKAKTELLKKKKRLK